MNSIFELSLNKPSLPSMQASACGENRTKGFDMKQLLERFSYKLKCIFFFIMCDAIPNGNN